VAQFDYDAMPVILMIVILMSVILSVAGFQA
jgi:hypothetical protein